MPTGQCHLCHCNAELQLSHVLPAFVFKWLRESSGNGHLRASDAPNLRVQDGIKLHLLCASCEELLSRPEGTFASQLFLPYTKGTQQIFRYSNWLMQFCTSISWRVLQFYLERQSWEGWTPESLAQIAEAEIVWREVLLGKRQHPGTYQQHILPLDRIESSTGEFAPSINRYLMRAVQVDICRGNESIFTYAKLGRFIILGFIHEPNMASWRGTKVHANEGIIEPREYVVPGALGHYLNEKAAKMSAALAGMSDAQHAKVDKAFRGNVDRYVDSDAFAAMQADVDMFGPAAFSKR